MHTSLSMHTHALDVTPYYTYLASGCCWVQSCDHLKNVSEQLHNIYIVNAKCAGKLFCCLTLLFWSDKMFTCMKAKPGIYFNKCEFTCRRYKRYEHYPDLFTLCPSSSKRLIMHSVLSFQCFAFSSNNPANEVTTLTLGLCNCPKGLPFAATYCLLSQFDSFHKYRIRVCIKVLNDFTSWFVNNSEWITAAVIKIKILYWLRELFICLFKSTTTLCCGVNMGTFNSGHDQ